MVNQKLFGIILLTFSLLGLAGFAMTNGNTSSAGINTPTEGNIPSADADPAGTQTTGAQVLTLSQETGLKFSGEVMTCTNMSDFEQVIDLKISNLDESDISVDIGYPFSRTIELIPGQIMNIELPLPYGVTSVDLSSNDEKLTLQVPSCVVRGGGSSGNSQSSFSSSNDISPPPPVPELSTMALTGIGLFGLIFIISRKQ